MPVEKWNIDLGHSSITFSIRHLVIAKVRGKFATFGGALELDESDLTRSKVSVEIDASSIDTGQPQRDTHLRSVDFFAVDQFPKATFASKSIKKDGDDYAVKGDLTMHGVTKEITLRATFLGKAADPRGNARAAFEAKTSISREDFGLSWNQTLEAGGVAVGATVELEIELEALKAPTA